MTRALLFALALAAPAQADTLVATHTIRAQTILTPADVAVVPGDTLGAYTALDEVVGQEARVAIYAGRPLRLEEVGPPALVERNQIVTLFYATGSLNIVAEGRALGRGGTGDSLRVMNMSSRQTVTGIVREDGTISVSPISPTFQLTERTQ